MKANIVKNEENIEKNKEEILSNLLKKLLEQKLTKLEKKHKIENKNIIEMSNTSQNLILSLENMSNDVRKQVYSKRQILINNASKLPKNMKIAKKIPEQKNPKVPIYQKKNLFLNNIPANTERNKSTIKRNTKNMKNVNKYFNTISNKTEKASNTSRRTISPFIIPKQREELKTITNDNKFNKNKKTPIKIKKNVVKKQNEEKSNNKNSNKNNISIDSTKKNQKEKSPINVNIQKKDINTINKFDSLDNFANNEILKKDTLLNKKDNDNNIINTDTKPEKPEKCNFLKNLSKEILKDTIKIDDKFVKDSLLVNNDINGNKNISIDDLISGPTFKEVIIDEDLFNNKDLIKDKKENDEKMKKKNELKNSSILIYNKLKRNKITFLEGEHDFDLIFKDEKIEDIEIDENLNKKNESDISLCTISEHNDEIFENNLDLIIEFLDYKDIYNVMLVNKECFKTIINIFISKKEITIDILQEEITKIKNNNPDINFENINKKKFNLSSNSLRAISLLNSSSGNNILKMNLEQLNKKEINLIYSLYFIATGKKSQISILDETKKMEFMQNYFKKNVSNNSFGKFIEKELEGKIFDEREIYALYKTSKNYLDNISPNYYQKIDKNIAIFVFIIKDILEQIGIIHSYNIKPDIEYLLLNSQLQANKSILDELEKIKENIYY